MEVPSSVMHEDSNSSTPRRRSARISQLVTSSILPSSRSASPAPSNSSVSSGTTGGAAAATPTKRQSSRGKQASSAAKKSSSSETTPVVIDLEPIPEETLHRQRLRQEDAVSSDNSNAKPSVNGKESKSENDIKALGDQATSPAARQSAKVVDLTDDKVNQDSCEEIDDDDITEGDQVVSKSTESTEDMVSVQTNTSSMEVDNNKTSSDKVNQADAVKVAKVDSVVEDKEAPNNVRELVLEESTGEEDSIEEVTKKETIAETMDVDTNDENGEVALTSNTVETKLSPKKRMIEKYSEEKGDSERNDETEADTQAEKPAPPPVSSEDQENVCRQNSDIQSVVEKEASVKNSAEKKKSLNNNPVKPNNKSISKRSAHEEAMSLGRRKSGRKWKVQRDRFKSVVKPKGLKQDAKLRLAQKQEKLRIREFEKALKEEKKQELEEKRKRQEENKKRKMENERKNEVIQQIKNPAKIKRMKKKQLRMLAKRDLTPVVGNNTAATNNK